MAETPNFQFYVSDDDKEEFLKWREKIAGASGSNFHRIDSLLKELRTAIDERDPDAITIPGSGKVSLDDSLKEIVGEGPYTIELTEDSDNDNMQSSVYDPTGKAQDIFKYVDDSIKGIPIPDNVVISEGGELFALTTLAATSGETITTRDGSEIVVRKKLERGGVSSFNGRKGEIVPQSGDYTADQVGAVPTSRTVNGKALSSDIVLSAQDVKARPAEWTPTASDVDAVPTSRTVNGKPLSENITLTASDVAARPSTWMPSASDVGARPVDWVPSADQVGAVPVTRKVNGKPLSSDITLTAEDVGARSADWIDDRLTEIFSGEISVPLATASGEKILTRDGLEIMVHKKLGGGAATSIDVPNKTSQLTNDSGYVTAAQVTEAIKSAVLASWEASY